MTFSNQILYVFKERFESFLFMFFFFFFVLQHVQLLTQLNMLSSSVKGLETEASTSRQFLVRHTHISETPLDVHRYMLISFIIYHFSLFYCPLSVGAADVCPAWRADLWSSKARLHQHLQILQPSGCYFSDGGTRSITQG